MAGSRTHGEHMIIHQALSYCGHASQPPRRTIRSAGRPSAAGSAVMVVVFVVFVMVLAISAGCGRRDMGRVSGTVTFQGKAVPKAMVQFAPQGRPMGFGPTDDAGRFVLNTLKKGDGAFQGACIVTVMPVPEFLPGSIAPIPRPDIPDKYRVHETTPFKADVVAGKSNEFTFDMQD